MKWAVLSPHPDDAVFSTWHVLSSALDVQVVTVFAGVPPDAYVSPLNQPAHAMTSSELMMKRRADDIAVLSAIGRNVIHCDFLDVQFRLDRSPELLDQITCHPELFVQMVSSREELRIGPAELLSGLAPLLAENELGIYAPVGIGGHPDHADVGRVGRSLLQHGRTVRFYADMPYLVRKGLPSWLAGAPSPAADAIFESAFRSLGISELNLRREIIRLDRAEAERKIAVAKLYQTEFEPANRDFGGILTDPAIMGIEVYWAADNLREAN